MQDGDPIQLVSGPATVRRYATARIIRALRTIHLAIWDVEILHFGTIRVLATDAHDARREAKLIFHNANTNAVVTAVRISQN